MQVKESTIPESFSLYMLGGGSDMLHMVSYKEPKD